MEVKPARSKTPKGEGNRFGLHMTALETRAMRGAYRERIARLVLDEEMSTGDAYDAIDDTAFKLASVKPTERTEVFDSELTEISETLLAFSEHTAEQTRSHLQRTAAMAYNNEQVVERIQLGKAAKDMSDTLAAFLLSRDLDALPQTDASPSGANSYQPK